MTSNTLPDENKKQQQRPLNIPFIFFPEEGILRFCLSREIPFYDRQREFLTQRKEQQMDEEFYFAGSPNFCPGEHIGCHSINIIAAEVMFG